MSTPIISRGRRSRIVAEHVEGHEHRAGDATRKPEPVGKKIAVRRWECPTCRARKVFRRRRAP
jgi:hypothetical protein